MDGAVTHDDGLSGRVALVTGAGGGVGRGIALALAAAGAHVVVAARRIANGDETTRLICDEGGSAIGFETDVCDPESVRAAVAGSIGQYGRLDVVVHNAGSRYAHAAVAIEDIDDERWRDEFGVALDGAFHLAQAAYPALRSSGQGRFVILCSVQGILGGAFNPAMSATKAAQRALVKSLAHEWGPDGILVNGVVPAAHSPSTEKYLADKPEVRERLLASFPLGRFGDARADVGSALVALAGDRLHFMTGQLLHINGGSFTAS
jgi:NAD(P)-dependent dehydrogenase (short-subunit alcohol dehydrogenase family)